MALFQEEQVTQEQFNKEHNLNQPDIFSNLGYDEIIQQRRETREKRKEEENLWVQNIVSPDKINQWKNQGKMTAIQVWHKKNKNELMPYMGSWKQGTKSFKIKDISEKLQSGQVITPEERQQFENFVLDLAEVQTRGYSFGGGTMNLGLETIPFMAEFAIGLLTSGGTSSVGATASKLSTEALKKGLTQRIVEGVGKTAYNATLNPRTYAFTATRLPQQVRARMGDILLSDSIAITPEGQAILKESEEKPATAFLKALALTNIEVASEMSGQMLVRPTLEATSKLGKVIASPVLKHLPKGFSENFVKLAEQVTKLPFAKAVDEFGWNGILEEMGEERIGGLLQFALNLDGEEGYSFEQLLDAIFPSPEQLAQEALSFGVTGLGINAVHSGLKKLPVVGDKYTKDGFLLDAGIFRMEGYDSYLDSKVKEQLQEKGKSEEEIDNALHFSTRDDKIQFLKDTKTEFDSKKEFDAKEFENDLQRMDVEETAYNKILQGGVSEDVAFANAKLFGQFFKKNATTSEEAKQRFKELLNGLDFRYDTPIDAEEKNQFQNAETAGAKGSAEISAAEKEWEEKGTESKYFKKWFGESRVVDGDGKPLIVYHNTNNDFEVFSREFEGQANGRPVYGGGFNFTAYKDYASSFGSKQMACYLSIKNPLNDETYNPAKFIEPVYKVFYGDNYKNYMKGSDNWTGYIEGKLDTLYGLRDLMQGLQYDKGLDVIEFYKSLGYDGIQDGHIWIAFKPEQIKSVDNQGTFDAENPNIYFQSAYHGTPHRFEEFSLDAIGTGEGAQAHGWGLYFASNKDVSENYRSKLSGDKVYYNGQEIKKAYYYTHLIEQKKEKELNRYLQDLRIVIDGINKIKTTENISMNEAKQKFIENYESKTKLLAFQKKLLEIAKNIDTTKIEIQKGQLFEVDIPDDEVLLDEDLLLNEQSETVRKAIYEYYGSRPADYMLPIDYNHLGGQTGGQFYKDVAYQLERENSLAYRMAHGLPLEMKENFNPNKEASLLLNSLGIKGIKYDGRSDGLCYVVFDDKAVDVIKTYYQDANDSEDIKAIAGFTYSEVLDKLTEIYDKLSFEGIDEETQDKLMAEAHVLEDAFEIAEGSDKFKNEEKNMEIMLNAYYIMNNQEIPKDYIDADAVSKRTYNDLKKLHEEKKEKAESEYYGYFTDNGEKSIITIMSNSNASTALHELGHFFLKSLNEIAKVDKQAQKQLDAVNKWLGYSGEYTVAQQEKFARSFEAYLYKGKAPNNSLRQVFENFKEWLKSVYNHITELERKGADLSPEVQELFDNIFGNDSYYQERKEATKLLKNVRLLVKKDRIKNVEVRKDDSLSEDQKRCKEVCYQILSEATGKDIGYLKRIFETNSTKNGYARRREVVEELIEHADDKITTSGGMREEWKEFFADTGVSYENDEVEGDYELADKALNAIINKDYWDADSLEKGINNRLDNEAEYFARAIDDATRQYNALIREYKKGNRDIVLPAIYDWLDSLDSQIKQDYEDKFIFDSGIIERNENADKFDNAKRQILSKAMELESDFRINENEKYKQVVMEIMKNLNFLQPSDKAKLTANILDIPSTSFLMGRIDSIMDIAKTMEDVNFRRNLEREIHKELQDTKNIKKNGRTVGKYDYRTNKIFEELRQLDRLSPEKANEMRLEVQKFATAEDNGLSWKDKLINKFLSYKAGGRTFADTELMKELFDEIQKIKLIGKSAKSEIELQEKLDESKDIEELINIVQSKKEAGSLIKHYIDKVANLESMLNAIFNADIKERYGAEILYAETQAQAWQHEQKQKFEQGVAKIYNLKNWNWDKKILEYLGENHTFTEIRRKYDTNDNLVKERFIDRTLNKMEIIQAFIWSKNEVLEKRLKNQFGEDTLETMFELLTKEDEKFAELMMSTAQSFYPLVNKAFIDKYGLDLPKVSCYFPSTPERGSEVDLYNDYSSKSLGNSFTKARAGSETQAMDFHNPVAVLYNHIDGVAKFSFMSSALDKANLRFKDLDLKRVIVNKYGEDVYRSLEQALINITYKKEAPVFNGMNKVIDNMVGNWIQANVAVKPIVGLKQLLSANNYAVDMPYMTWQNGFLKALANPKETIDYMMSIPYIKARFEGSYSNEFLKQTVENSKFAMTKKLKDCCNLFIKIGDIGAIIFGGKPYIDYLINEKGISEEEAIKQFILSTNRSQQSSAISSLSNFQVNMTRNAFGKLAIAFKNSPQQYVRKCGDAIVSVANGDMTKEQCAKELFQYAYLQPFFYAVATSGSLLRFLFTGDDDDLLKDAQLSVFNLNSNAIPLLGDVYQYALNKLVFKEKAMPQVSVLAGDIEKEINRISKEDAELKDYLEAIGYIGLHVGLGYNSKAIANIGSGVGDIATGETVQGAMKVLGYTDKRSKHIAGNEKKK